MDINVINEAESFYDFQKKLDEKIYQIDENAFVDGIINFEKYSANPLKILWILKDTNSYEEKQDWRKELKEISNGNLGAFRNTFENIIYITYGILNQKKYSEEFSIDINPEHAKVLEEIAFINVKKTPGGSKIDFKTLENYYLLYKDVILEQIKIYQPTIIINSTGNSLPVLREDIKEIKQNLSETIYIKTSDLGVDFSVNKELIVFNTYHPMANRPNRNVYCNDIINNYLLLTQKS